MAEGPFRWMGFLKKIVAPLAVIWGNKNIHGRVVVEKDGIRQVIHGQVTSPLCPDGWFPTLLWWGVWVLSTIVRVSVGGVL
jgi:hypothetical protein